MAYTQKSLPLVVEQRRYAQQQQVRVITPDDPEVISHLLVTTKAYDVRAAVAGIAHLLAPDSVVLLLVNGMGLAEQLGEDWPQLDIFCGTSTEGAYTIAPQHIRHAGRGETRIGRQGQQQPPAWFGQWGGAIKPCIWDANIATALWSKLAVNCIINPADRHTGCANGVLAQRRELAAEVATLCDEVAPYQPRGGLRRCRCDTAAKRGRCDCGHRGQPLLHAAGCRARAAHRN